MSASRNRELLALVPVALLLTAGFATVFAQNDNQLTNLSLSYGLYFLAICLATHIYIRIRLPNADSYLFPLMALLTAFGLVMAAAAHAHGWPLARGGSQRIADALVSYLRSLGGEIVTDHRVGQMSDLPPSRVVLFDVTPRQLLAIAGDALPHGYRRRLERYRYGAGSYKVDFALDGPIPWRARTRPPSYIHLSILPKMIEGHMMSDVVAVLGSLNIIAAELDR